MHERISRKLIELEDEICAQERDGAAGRVDVYHDPPRPARIAACIARREEFDTSLISILFDAPGHLGVVRTQIFMVGCFPRLFLCSSDVLPPYYEKIRSYNTFLVSAPSAPRQDASFADMMVGIAAVGLWNKFARQPGDVALTANDLEETIAGTIHKSISKS